MAFFTFLRRRGQSTLPRRPDAQRGHLQVHHNPVPPNPTDTEKAKLDQQTVGGILWAMATKDDELFEKRLAMVREQADQRYEAQRSHLSLVRNNDADS